MKQCLLLDETVTITLKEVCQQTMISKTILLELLEHGLLGEIYASIDELQFDFQKLQRLQSALRLQNDLGVNPPGAVVILELLDKLNALQEELSILRRHLE